MVFIISTIKGWFKKVKRQLYDFLFERHGSQKILKKKSLFIIGSLLVLLIICAALTRRITKDTSHLGTGKVDKNSSEKSQRKNSQVNVGIQNAYHAASIGASKENSNNSNNGYKYQPPKINYRAVQVIERDNLENEKDTLPIGTKFIGKMLSSVDTREAGVTIEVLLPYGAAFKSEKMIPDDSIIMGVVQYSGKGQKFFINFSHIVFPDGSEHQVHAQALDSKDYSVGLIGEFHGHVGARVASTLALTAIGTAADIMVSKVPVGPQGIAIAKPNMKNALYGAASKTAEFEANRQAKELTSEKDYITFDSGSDLIISLTKSFRRND